MLLNKVRWQAKLTAMLIAGVIIGGGTAVVLASIPDPNGVIHGCYRSTGIPANGQVRIIDNASQTCNASEASITWNQTGPQGPVGPAGSGGFVSNLVGADFSSANFPYHALTNLDIHDSNFQNANLTGSKFTGSITTGLNLRNARLNKADFQAVDLSGSQMGGTASTGLDANFFGANMTSIVFSGGSNFTGANFQNTNFTNASFGTVAALGLIGGDFRGANFTGASVETIFTNATFEAVDFRPVVHATIGASFRQSNLKDADFRNLTVNSQFTNNNDVTNANFDGAQFINANLSDTNFSNAILTNTTWSNTICPDDTNSNDNGNTCIGHLVP